MFGKIVLNQNKDKGLKKKDLFKEERFITLVIKERKRCVLSLEVYIILQSLKYTFPTLMETKKLKII